MRPPNSVPVAPNPTPVTVDTITIDNAAVDIPTTDTDAGHIDYPASSSLAESLSPNSYPSLHSDDIPPTSHSGIPWSPAYLPQDHSEPGKEIDAGSNNDEDQHQDPETDVAMAEGGDNDEEMDQGGDVESDFDGDIEEVTTYEDGHVEVATTYVDVDEHMEPFSEFQPIYTDDGHFPPSDIPTSPAPPTVPHPGLAPMGHQPLGISPGIGQALSGHTNTSVQLQQQLPYADHLLSDETINSNHPMMLSNQNPMSLGPENPGLVDFLRHWVWQSQASMPRATSGIPLPMQVRDTALQTPRRVTYNDLNGDEYDFQGINWSALGISRSLARKHRLTMYANYTNKKDSDLFFFKYPDRLLPTVENYFRFRRMDVRNDVRLLHFQLRNIFGCASRTRAFYPSYGTIQEVDLNSGRNKTAMKFDNDTDAQISTLTASEQVLLVGGFYGDYRYRCLDSQDPEPIEGRLTDNISGITNHVQLYSSRQSSAPLAAFASNDFGFRIVDLTTNKITSELVYDYAMNCSALSPDGRLRVMVGDSENVLITDAENGEVLQQLEGHKDFGFACDWAPDGWTVATGNQDKAIMLWDARKWRNSKGQSNPISVVRTSMSGARSLRFSPLGSGKRVLVAAEEADLVHAIDAQTLNSKQTFDVFGELGGLSFANDGQDLLVLSCDHHRGGVLQLERCDAGTEDAFDYAFMRYRDPRDWWRTPGYDWMPSPEQVDELPVSQLTLTQRRRKAALMDDLDPF